MEALHTLGIDFKVILAQIINFGILLAVLTKLLYRPILNALEERRKRIEESLKKADEIDQKTVKMEEELAHKRSLAKTEAAGLITEAKIMAEKDREQILIAAATESDRLKTAAREQMEIEREAMHEETKKRVGKLALVVVAKALGKNVSEEFQKNNIDQALKEIEAL